MAISSLALKILGGSVATVGTATTGYLVWNNFANTGLTKHDKLLLQEEENFKKLTWSTNSGSNPITTTATASEGASQLKMIFNTSTDKSKTISFQLEISKTDSNPIVDGSEMKKWICIISQKNTTPQDLDTETNSQIANLKTSFGIGTNQAIGDKWKSIKTFIERCAYQDRKNDGSLDNNKNLSREIKLETKVKSGGNKHEFIGLDKFFIKQATT